MKKILVFVSLLIIGSVARAGQPVSVVKGNPESSYDYTNGTLSVSSFSAAGFSVTTGYREIRLAPSTSFFYVLDGTSSTSTIVSTGYPALAAGTTPNADIVIESNKAISITLPAGIAATSLRYIQKKK